MTANSYTQILAIGVEAYLGGAVAEQDVVILKHGKHQAAGSEGRQHLAEEIICL